MSLHFLLTLATLVVLMANPANARLDGFDCSFELGSGDQSIRRFTLTEDVYRCTRHTNQADLVVVNSQGEPVPLTHAKAETMPDPKVHERPMRFYSEPSPPSYETGEQIRRIAQLTGITSKAIDNDQWQEANRHYSSLILERGEPSEALTQITIDAETNGTSVSTTIMLEESEDMKYWTTLVRPQVVVFLESEGGQLRQNSIKLGTSGRAKYLRLAMLGNVEDFGGLIEGVTGHFTQAASESEKPQWHWLEAGEFQAMESTGEWKTSLPGLFPVSRIRFTHAADIVLYSGAVYVQPHNNPPVTEKPERLHAQSREKIKNRIKDALDGELTGRLNEQNPWRYRTDFTQYQLATETGSMSRSHVELPITYGTQWKFAFRQPTGVTVDQLPLIEFGWQPRQIAFVTQGAGPFYVLAGRDEPASKSQFPSHLFDATATAQSVELLSHTFEFVAPPSDESDDQLTIESHIWGKVLLWSLLCLGVGLMLTMAYRLSKQIT